MSMCISSGLWIRISSRCPTTHDWFIPWSVCEHGQQTICPMQMKQIEIKVTQDQNRKAHRVFRTIQIFAQINPLRGRPEPCTVTNNRDSHKSIWILHRVTVTLFLHKAWSKLILKKNPAWLSWSPAYVVFWSLVPSMGHWCVGVATWLSRLICQTSLVNQ